MVSIVRALLVAVFLLAPAMARAEWREATTDHFVIVSGGSERQLIETAQRLEALHWLLGQATNVTNPRNGARVRIYMVDRLRDVLRAYGGRNSNTAGFYRPSEEGAIAVVPRDQDSFSTTILYHEYAHHFMLQYMVNAYPPWLVEGFAEVVSTARFPEPNVISYGYAAQHRQPELLYGGWVPVSEMFAPWNPENRRQRAPTYGQYWLATHYLLFDQSRMGQLNQFVRAVNQGTPLEQAYAVFTGGLDQLNSDMRRYLRTNSFPYRNVTMPPDVMRAPAIRTLRPGEEAIIDDELLAMRPMTAAEHVPVATRVRAIGVRYPSDPAVALLEARLWRWAERWADAEAAVDRAIAADPQNVRALTFKGQIMLERRQAEGTEMSADVIRAARALIVRANRLDPEDQMPLLAYYMSFRLAGQTPTDTAVDGLHKAMELVPQMQSLRLMLINEMVERRQFDMARLLLRPLAFDPHRAQLRDWASEQIAWIEAGATGERPGTAAPGDATDDDAGGSGSGEGGSGGR